MDGDLGRTDREGARLFRVVEGPEIRLGGDEAEAEAAAHERRARESRGRRRRRRLSLRDLGLGLAILPAYLLVSHLIERGPGADGPAAAPRLAAAFHPVTPAEPAPPAAARTPEAAALPLAAPDGTTAALARAARPQAAAPRFRESAAAVLGYAEGMGFAHRAYGILGGTHCRMGAGVTLVWSRAQAGGSGCKVVLFDRRTLAEGWRVAALTLRLGFGTSVEAEPAATGPAAREGSRLRLALARSRVPQVLRLNGEIPLPGAEFWVAIESLELVGPPGARSWREAFER